MENYNNLITEEKFQKDVISKLEKQGWKELTYFERNFETQVVIKDVLYKKISEINPKAKENHINECINKILNVNEDTLIKSNKRIHNWLINGIDIEDKSSRINPNIKIIDFNNIEKNTFNSIQELRVSNGYEVKRLDITLFINGIPLFVFELKSPSNSKVGVVDSFQQIKTYQNKLNNIYKFNTFNVIYDGHNALFGSLTSNLDRYQLWKKVSEKSKVNNNSSQLINTMIDGLFNHKTILDVMKNFIIFTRKDEKIISAYHQYYGMKKAVDSIVNSKDKKGGIVWHTQGSGKSYSMVFLSKGIIDRMNNPTIVVITDRIDLDTQLFLTFSNSQDFLKNSPIKIDTRSNLIKKLKSLKVGGIIFTTIQKFTEDTGYLSERKNIVVIADEAHRSHDITKLSYKIGDEVNQLVEQKHSYSHFIKVALPNATLVGFTGTPINNDDRQTTQTFGPVIDVYDMRQSVRDRSTVPIKYEQILVKVELIENQLNKINGFIKSLEAQEDPELIEAVKDSSLTLAIIIGDKNRLDAVSSSFIKHYNTRKDQLFGKAMYVAYNRKIAFDMYNLLIQKDPSLKDHIKLIVTSSNQDPKDMSDAIGLKEKQQKWINDFKDKDSNIKIVIVVDMLLTGYDIPCLDVMYIDKPLRMHNLMQAIARVNRKYPNKESGLIVDFIGLGKYIEEAVSYYTQTNSKDEITIETSATVINKLKDIVERIENIFYKFDYSNFFNKESERYAIVVKMYSYLCSLDNNIDKEDKKTWNRFKKLAKELYQGYKYVLNSVSDKEMIDKITLFLAVWTFGRKSRYAPTINPIGFENIKKQLMNLVESAIIDKQIITIEDTHSESEIDLLTDENIKIMKEKYQTSSLNVLTTEWLEKEIKYLSKKNIIIAKEFNERLKKLIKNYNKVSDPEAMLAEMIKLSKELKNYYNNKNNLGLDEHEYAFYSILGSPEEVKSDFDKDMLVQMAKDLLVIIGNNKTVDWFKRKQVKDKMRYELKRLTKKYKYPPTETNTTIEDIIKQAENMKEYL